MARTVWGVGVLARAYFEVYSTSNAPVTGLLDGAFTKVLSLDGSVSAVPVTVTEVASGVYVASFTPAVEGQWHLVVRNSSYMKRGYHETFDVTGAGVFDLDAAGEIDGYSVRDAMKFMAAVLAGKKSGGLTAPVFRALDDSAVRVAASCLSPGDRVSVTLTP